MSSRKGPLAAVLLTGLLALPAAAQCQRGQSGPSQTGGMQTHLSQMFGTGQTGMTRLQVPQLSLLQSQQMQMFALRQVQLFAFQQTQVVAVQEQMLALREMQMEALRRQEMDPVRQPAPLPPDLQAVRPQPSGPALKKQGKELLDEMSAVQHKLDGLLDAARRNELNPADAAAVQQEVNALQGKVDALPKPPDAVLDQMCSLRRQTDGLTGQIGLRPADAIAALRKGR